MRKCSRIVCKNKKNQTEISEYAMRILKMQKCRCLSLNATVICLIAKTLGQRVECRGMERAVYFLLGSVAKDNASGYAIPDTRYQILKQIAQQHQHNRLFCLHLSFRCAHLGPGECGTQHSAPQPK